MTARWFLLILALALCACNAAISDRPLFAASEQSTKIRLADGLWLLVNEDCKVATEQPTEDWPKCADWVKLDRHRIVGGSDNAPDDIADAILIADGSPPLIQAAYKARDDKLVYAFLALEPKGRSATGQVTAARLWMVPCGTITDKTSMTIEPYDGFNEGCMPQDVQALHAAAAKGPSDPDDITEWTWVRQPTSSSGLKK